jgi:hypothetical protein
MNSPKFGDTKRAGLLRLSPAQGGDRIAAG